jgi:hypothetical protein
MMNLTDFNAFKDMVIGRMEEMLKVGKSEGMTAKQIADSINTVIDTYCALSGVDFTRVKDDLSNWDEVMAEIEADMQKGFDLATKGRQQS